ncbi:hypothetical protein [Litoreibacter roseus]|uniref:Uncharacterized protein n=1 Tax=Litoreibacter roseus TaxID=2601869 RepID=A0A6N6JM37_9RHOB|nr:hypothetical protein [Litoreibacter roseus]GFE67373.1 hypothetical protein KIN_44470 [Litoreibacter roseus]
MTLTVGDLKRQLEVFDDKDELAFSGGLEFYRLEVQDENLVVFEFNEFEAALSERFVKKHPQVKVVFCSVT